MCEERTLWERHKKEENASSHLEKILNGKVNNANNEIKNLDVVEDEEKKDIHMMLG